MTAPGRRPSLAELAAAVGMSTATVSHVFNRPERVSAATRARVLRAAEALGYGGPDPVGRQLRRGRADALGVLFTDELWFPFEDPAAGRFLAGLAAACAPAGLNLLLVPAGPPGPPGAPSATGNVARAAVDGFVVYSVADDDPHLAAVLRRRVPTVVVDSPLDTPGVDRVGSDDRAGARAVGEHLVALGHRRIGVISSRLTSRPVDGPAPESRWQAATFAVQRQRVSGLDDALRSAAPDAELTVQERVDNTAEAGAAALDALLTQHPDLTAVCCLSDVLALGALAAAARRGLRVPDDLTITGYDDVPESARAGLTTVGQPHGEKGRLAGDLFLTAGVGEPRERSVATVLQVRRTSGPPPAAS